MCLSFGAYFQDFFSQNKPMRHLIAQYEYMSLQFYLRKIEVRVTHHMVVNIDVPASWCTFSGILVHVWVDFHQEIKVLKIHKLDVFLKNQIWVKFGVCFKLMYIYEHPYLKLYLEKKMGWGYLIYGGKHTCACLLGCIFRNFGLSVGGILLQIEMLKFYKLGVFLKKCVKKASNLGKSCIFF